MNKIKILCSSIFIAVFISPFAQATTITTGISATSSVTWGTQGSPYIIPNPIIVEGTLTIEPGVEVRFGQNSGMTIQGNGILIAEGTPNSTITFTSHQDIHTKGYWKGIQFTYISKISRLKYCQIEYGGGDTGNISCNDCTTVLPIIDTCTISNSSTDGIYSYAPFSQAVLNIHNCIIRDNNGYPVSANLMIDMENNTFINNGEGAQKNVIRIFGHINYGISKDITWHNQGIPYLITNGNLLIGDMNAPGTLTIDAGVTIRIDKNNSIIIGNLNNSGCLQANGAEGAYITFTSHQLHRNPGDWGYVKFDEYSQNSYLDYCNIEYAGEDSEGAKSAVWCTGVAPKISYVDISKVYSHGIMCEYGSKISTSASPTIIYTTIVAGTASYEVDASAIFSHNASPLIGSSTLMKSKYGIYNKNTPYVQPYYFPTIINSNIIGNTVYGVYNEEREVGTVTATHNWWGISTSPYSNTAGGNYASDFVDYSDWIQEDKVAPGEITLEIKQGYVEAGTVTLCWLPSGDDMVVGTPTYYVINYATTSITNDNWGKVLGSITLTPSAISIQNGTYSYPVKDLIPKTEYFFCIKAVDDVGNWSELSNCIATTTVATFAKPEIYTKINGNELVGLDIYNTDSQQVGIWLFYGTRTPVSSEDYIERIDVGVVDSQCMRYTTVSNLDNGKLYYFAAYAYDPGSPNDKNRWSFKSNEAIGSPTVLTSATITGSLKVIVEKQTTYLARGLGSFNEPLEQTLMYSWSIIPESLGTINPTVGTETGFTAWTKAMTGSLTVVITDGTNTVSNTITITLLAGSATTVKINTPEGTTTTADGTLTFTGEGCDKWGNQVVEGTNFFWEVKPGLWSINPSSGATVTLTGTKATTGTLTLNADGTQTSISVTILPTSTTKFTFDKIPSPQKLGTLFDITLNSADKFDNPTQDDKITGTVSLFISTGTGTELATMTVTSGVGTISLSLNIPGVYTIYARGTFNTSIVLQGTSNPFLVEPGTPTQFIFDLPATTTYISADGTITITAHLADENKIQIGTAGINCILWVNILSGNAGTLGTTSILTDVNGQITTTYQVGTTSGSQVEIVITTSAFGTITGTSSLIITTGGTISRFEFDEIGTQAVGISFWGTITAKDSYGNTADFVGTAALSVAGGVIIPTVTTAFSNGMWAGSITIITVMENASITATHLPSGAFGTSNPFNVTPGPLHHINIIPDYATTTVSGTISFTCQGKDEYENDIEGLTYTWTSQYGSFTPAQGTSTIFKAGTLATIGTISVESGTIIAVGTVTILPGTLTFLSIIPSPATMTAGSTLTLTAIGYDEYGNTRSVTSCNWETNIGTITYAPPGTIAYLYATKTGTGIATATSSGIATLTTIQVFAGALHHFEIDEIPTLKAGENVTFQVHPKDKFSNQTSNANMYLGSLYKGSISWSPTLFHTTNLIAGSWATVGTYNIVARNVDDTIRGTSNTFSVTPATNTARFNIDLGTTSVPVGATTAVTLKLEDEFGNPVKIEGTTATLSVIGTGTLDISLGTTNAEGKIEATFTASTILGTESKIQIVSVYGTATSNTITTTTCPLSYITLSTATINLQVAGSCTIIATGYDKFGYEIEDLIFEWAVTIGSLSSTYGTSSDFYAGTNAGKGTLTIKSGDIATETTININSGPIDHFTFATITNQIVDKIFYGTITALDKYENLVTNYSTTTGIYDAKWSYCGSSSVKDGVGTYGITLGIDSQGELYLITKDSSGNRGTSNNFLLLIDDDKGGTITAQSGIQEEVRYTSVVLQSGAFAGTDYYMIVDTSPTDGTITQANSKIIASTTCKFATCTTIRYTVFDDTKAMLSQNLSTDTVTITIPYYDDRPGDDYIGYGNSAMYEDLLEIYRLDEGNQQWVSIQGTSTVNMASDTVTASIPYLSATYILIGKTPQLDHFTIGTIPSPQPAGQEVTIEINARDKNNNLLDGANLPQYSGTATLNINRGTGSVFVAEVSIFTSGVAYCGYLLTYAAPQVYFEVKDLVRNKVGTSNTFEVQSAPYNHFEFDFIGDLTIGIPATITIYAKDQYGNIDNITQATITATLSITVGDIYPTITTNFKSGTRTWTGTITISQPQQDAQIIAIDVGSSTIMGTSNTFNVVSATPDRIEITPAMATVTVQGTVAFTAQAWAGNYPVPDLGYTWTVSSNLLGSISPTTGTNTLFTAGTKAMTGTIAVTSGTITAIATITVSPGTAASLYISPIGTTTTSGSEVSYEATAVDGYGNTWTVTAQTQFETNDPLGTMTSGTNIYKAGKVGTWTITATYTYTSVGTATYVIVEHGTPTSLSIIPEGSTAKAGDTIIYTAIARDNIGNTWTVTEDTVFATNDPVGTITLHGTYTAGKVGTWTITGTYISVGTATYVIVERGTPTSLSIIPEGSTAKAGNTIIYTAIASDTKGNTWTVTSQTEFATNDPVGTITLHGIYTAGKVGTWTIAGTYTSVVGTATYVIVEPGTPTSLSIIPAETTAKAGDTIIYTAIALDTKGNTWIVTSQTEFATNDPVGTIALYGIYTAGKVGTWTIAGTHTSGVGTATYVVVKYGTPTALSIIPEGTTTKAGDTIIYTAIASDTKGNTWTVTSQTEFATNDPVGTITLHGTYTAGKVGTWTIAGTYASVGTATYVIVEYGTPTSLSIIPEGTTTKAGDTIIYTAIASDTKGNTWTVTSQTEFATSDPVGTITLHGTYTAGKVGTWTIRGTYTVLFATAIVYVEHGSGTTLFISPATATVGAAGTISYTTIAVDSYGNTWTVTADTVFATNDPVGTMTAGKNIYTAGERGTHTIYATYTLIGTTATVYVTVGELDHFKIGTDSIHYFKNEPGTITVSAHDKMNNLVATSTSFTLTPHQIITPISGTTSDNGSVTMQVIISKAGPVTIIVVQDNIRGSVSLTILMHREDRGTETLTTDDGLETIVAIPGNTIATDYYVVIGTPTEQTNPDIRTANNNLTSSYKIIKSAVREFNLKDESNGTVTLPATSTVTITIPYKDINPNDEYVEIDGVKVKENTLWIYRLQNGKWVKIPEENQHPDRINNWVSAKVDKFSIFTLIGQAIAPNLSKVLVFPNPVWVNKGDKEVIFKNLSKDVVIRIYTISGELVSIKEGVEGIAYWDLKNDYNQPVASGVYIYIIHDKNEIVKGKIAVIR
ncbi:MAG: T9SS type A sorting domain-containing protein [bacterium]